MAGTSKIEWTEATWNPIVGCSLKSPGCTNCYAMRMAWRLSNNPAIPHYAGTAKIINGNPVFTGHVAKAPEDALLAPLHWRKPRRIFVNSMGDLFHENIPDEWIDQVFAVMALCPQHTFQVLTKRAARMRDYCDARGQLASKRISRLAPNALVRWPLPNVWLGVSTERQQEADERIPHLLKTPAAVRFISAEPLIGSVDLRTLKLPKTGQYGTFVSAIATGGAGIFDHQCHRIADLPRLDWVIVGGESGPNARPMHPHWARSLRDQCKTAGVPFFFKQWGEWLPSTELREPWRHETVCVCTDGRVREWQTDFPGARLTDPNMRPMCSVGKKKAGRLLDGREHNEFPLCHEREAA